MRTNFDSVTDRKNTESVKWDYNLKTFGREDVLPMWVADMDFPSPPAIAEAVCKRAGHPVFGYTGVPDSYCEAVIGWIKKRNHWDLRKEWLVHSPGVVTSINTAVLAFTQPGDGILIQTPVYRPFFTGVTNNGRRLVTNPLQPKGGRYVMDYEDLEAKLRDGIKMMILCSPHNPVGRVWSREELSSVVKLCAKYNVLLVSDEIHSDLVYKGYTHIPVAALPEASAHAIITCISPTKTFNIAGLVSSFAILPTEAMRKQFERTLHRTGAGMNNIFGMIGGEAAFLHGEEWLEELLAYLRQNLDLVLEYFAERIPGIHAIKPEGTYLVWLDCRKLGMDPATLKDFFIHRAGVGLSEGVIFGEDGAGFQRMNIACPRTMLLEGLERIERAVRELRLQA